MDCIAHASFARAHPPLQGAVRRHSAQNPHFEKVPASLHFCTCAHRVRVIKSEKNGQTRLTQTWGGVVCWGVGNGGLFSFPYPRPPPVEGGWRNRFDVRNLPCPVFLPRAASRTLRSLTRFIQFALTH